jgi:hypothetical protein
MGFEIAAGEHAAMDRRMQRLDPSISGKPVTLATSATGKPASAIALAEPPVETSATPRSTSARAKSTRPVLS